MMIGPEVNIMALIRGDDAEGTSYATPLLSASAINQPWAGENTLAHPAVSFSLVQVYKSAFFFFLVNGSILLMLLPTSSLDC